MIMKKGHACRQAGFTLLELIMVLSIIAILVMALLVTINPTRQLDKGHDATRKKDLKRISIAFEEFYNDKGCYPSQDVIDALACGSRNFYQLSPWPCDPTRSRPYDIMYGEGACPGWFTVVTRLETEGENRECNYGVNSTNQDWREVNVCYGVVITPTVRPGQVATNTPTPEECVPDPGPCYLQVSGDCNSLPDGCIGSNCCLNSDCSVTCISAPACGCGPQ